MFGFHTSSVLLLAIHGIQHIMYLLESLFNRQKPDVTCSVFESWQIFGGIHELKSSLALNK